MSDPPRLLEGASREAELLEAWTSMRAPENARAKALALAGLGAGAAALGASLGAAKGAAGAAAGTSVVPGTAALGAGVGAAAGTGIAAGAGGAVVSAGATGAGVLATKWLAAVGIVAVLGGGSVVAAKKMSAPTASTATATTGEIAQNPALSPAREAHDAHRDEELRGSVPAAPSGSSSEPTPPAVAAADLPNAEPKRVHSTTTPARPSARPSPNARTAPEAPEAAPASTLGAEVSSLDSARNALRTGDPARALRELDAFDAKHPSSALAEDAALLRFDANVALGDRAGADKAARTFLARYPTSPRATKVRRYLDGAN